MPKHYCRQSNNTFRVMKQINGKQLYFGTYKTEKEAQNRVEQLKRCNWDENETVPTKHYNNIYYRQGSYYIYKKQKYWGMFKTHEEAEKAVEFFKQHNWDHSLVKYKNNLNNPVGKYLSKNASGNYQIHKKIDGRMQHFGTFKTLEEAQKERDHCIASLS